MLHLKTHLSGPRHETETDSVSKAHKDEDFAFSICKVVVVGLSSVTDSSISPADALRLMIVAQTSVPPLPMPLLSPEARVRELEFARICDWSDAATVLPPATAIPAMASNATVANKVPNVDW